MHLQETIFSSGSGSITLHDIQTGISLSSFKGSTSSTHGIAYLESTSKQGGLILAAQQDKGLLHVYNFQKDQIALKIVLPEKLTCIALDPTGEYCAGGTSQGRIYLWETASGVLFNAWDAHYRAVTVLRYTGDGNALISGSDDSGVSVWSMASLLDSELQNSLPAPVSTLSDHTLPITDIICGVGPYPKCRLLTSSIDCSVKLWDLSSPSASALLTTFLFPSPISCLAFDPTERFFFASSSPNNSDGVVYRMDLYSQKALGKSGDASSGMVMEAVGGQASLDIIRVGTEEGAKNKIVVGEPVTALAISLTSSVLLVGTGSGQIHTYDVPSSQRLKSVAAHKGSPITTLASMMKPCDLVGHVSLSLGFSSDTKDAIPVKPIVPFQRIRDAKNREAHELSVVLGTRTFQDVVESDEAYYRSQDMLDDHAFFVGPSHTSAATSGEPDTVSLNVRVKDLEQEVESLKAQLSKAKGINDAMWEGVVKNMVYGQAGKDQVNGQRRGEESDDDRMEIVS